MQPRFDFVADPASALIHAFKYEPRLTQQPLKNQLITLREQLRVHCADSLASIEGTAKREQLIPFDQAISRVAAAISQMRTTPEFKEFLAAIERSTTLLKSEWQRLGPPTTKIMAELTDIDFSKKGITVNVMHPGLPAGHCNTKNNSITWRYVGDEFPQGKSFDAFPFYNTVYLWHERLHAELPDGDLEHAVIQLLTDNELRVRLNGGSYPPFVGHDSPEYSLMERMAKYLEDWNKFKASAPPRDIHLFCKALREKFGE